VIIEKKSSGGVELELIRDLVFVPVTVKHRDKKSDLQKNAISTVHCDVQEIWNAGPQLSMLANSPQ
jgi:hypothetical protein